MPTGVPKHRSYSGQGRYPNNIDTMRRAAGVLIKHLCMSTAKGGAGITSTTLYTLLRGNKPLPDALAARLANRFKCSINDLRWKGSTERNEIVPYEAPALPAVPAARGRSRKASPAEVPKVEPVEITIAIGGRLVGGLTMFDPRATRRILRDVFGGDDDGDAS